MEQISCKPILDPNDIIELEHKEVCPHWQRLNVRGECIDRYWAGPPVATIVNWVGLLAFAYVVAKVFGLRNPVGLMASVPNPRSRRATSGRKRAHRGKIKS